jgi:hypothetical protein
MHMRRLIAGYASAVLVGVGVLASAAVVAVGTNALFASSSFAATTTCNGTISFTTITGSVTVPSGAFCTLDNVLVTGSVIVQPGAGDLVTEDGSTIDGYVTSNGAGAIQIMDTTVKASVNVTNTDPAIPQSSRIVCSTVDGYVNVSGTNHNSYWNINDYFGNFPCSVGEGDFIGSSVTYNNNKGGGDISQNIIGNDVMCSGNKGLTGTEDETNGGVEPSNGLFGQCAGFDVG